ncbi:tRNA pseudouridine(55) synthase TruB [Pseudocitrobacter faecalis]
MSRPRRRGRDIHGVLLLDKPQGASSNDVLQKVKRLYNANRAGHTGALDPLATGMLPICLGEATKFSQYLLDSDKRYRVIARLGQRTDTSDADGQIVEERPVTFTDAQLAEALESFRGDTQQVPSMYSALKYQGKKLYEYARQGIEVPVKRARLPCMSCCLFAMKAMNWSWKFTVQKAPTFAPSLMIWAKNSAVART